MLYISILVGSCRYYNISVDFLYICEYLRENMSLHSTWYIVYCLCVHVVCVLMLFTYPYVIRA